MLVTSLNDHHLQQLQREPTRENNILDLFITNKPSLVKSLNTIPNISDHEGCIIADFNLRPPMIKKKPQPYHLLSKVNWGKIKEEVAVYSSAFSDSYSSRSVDENWEEFKNVINLN